MSVLPLLKFDLRPVPSASGTYVTEDGKVYSRTRYAPNVLARRATFTMKNGYQTVTLQRNKRSAPSLIHRLVCEAFHGPSPQGYETRHLDGDRSNNSSSNLKWGTSRENTADTIRHGRHARGEQSCRSKLKVAQVREIRQRLASGQSMNSLAKEFHVSPWTITAIRDRVCWAWLQ